MATRLEVDRPVLNEDREAVRLQAGEVPARVKRRDVDGAEVTPARLPDRTGEQSSLDLGRRGGRAGQPLDVKVRADREGLLCGPELRGPHDRSVALRCEDNPLNRVHAVEVESQELRVHPRSAVEPPLRGGEILVFRLLPSRERIREPRSIEVVQGSVQGHEGGHVGLRGGPHGHVHRLTAS
ncbi:MAG: hypothetical protein E6K13_04050 [Methanobacteriota archaeon]|nr:MAG: hypothetical protein E6K13_04050 [Euryarchaeota archaeon]